MQIIKVNIIWIMETIFQLSKTSYEDEVSAKHFTFFLQPTGFISSRKRRQ